MENAIETKLNHLQLAIDELSQTKTAQVCRVTQPSVYKWRKRGLLPRTDYTGDTKYADAICEALNGKYTPEDLLPRSAAIIADSESTEQGG